MFYRSKLRDSAYLYDFGIAEHEFEVRISKFQMVDAKWWIIIICTEIVKFSFIIICYFLSATLNYLGLTSSQAADLKNLGCKVYLK